MCIFTRHFVGDLVLVNTVKTVVAAPVVSVVPGFENDVAALVADGYLAVGAMLQPFDFKIVVVPVTVRCENVRDF